MIKQLLSAISTVCLYAVIIVMSLGAFLARAGLWIFGLEWTSGDNSDLLRHLFWPLGFGVAAIIFAIGYAAWRGEQAPHIEVPWTLVDWQSQDDIPTAILPVIEMGRAA